MRRYDLVLAATKAKNFDEFKVNLIDACISEVTLEVAGLEADVLRHELLVRTAMPGEKPAPEAAELPNLESARKELAELEQIKQQLGGT